MEKVIPKNDFYAGFLYAKFWDPVMKNTRALIAKQVPGGSTVIDVASGTGHQLCSLAPHISRGIGLDLSDRMMRYAENKKLRNGYAHLSFELGDAGDLSRFTNGSFDIAMATLVLHEVPAEKRLPILSEMKRVANTVIIADYTNQASFPRQLIDLMENTVGICNSRHYKSYQTNGSMPPLLKKAGLIIKTYETALHGMLGIWSCK